MNHQNGRCLIVACSALDCGIVAMNYGMVGARLWKWSASDSGMVNNCVSIGHFLIAMMRPQQSDT